MEFRSKVKNKVISGQSREIIYSVLKFMKEEAESGNLIALSKTQERVAKATGVSLRTIGVIAREGRQIENGKNTSFSTPNNKRKVTHTKVYLDDFDRSLLRRIITNFYITEKRAPTGKHIHQKFCTDTGYSGSIKSLRKAVRDIGFSWFKTKNNRKLLMESHDIRKSRANYLRNIKKFREENRRIVYMDETYINASHTNSKNWNGDTYEEHQAKYPKGPKLIIIHAGGSEGFVNGAYLSWVSNNTKTAEHHQEINFSNYKKWVQEKLIPNLSPGSVLVMDSAPHHNKQIEKYPTCASSKAEMQSWLREKNIPFQENMLKVDLYSLIKLNKPAHKQYEIDVILQANGFEVLRLPPYHPDLNPIEMVWALLKQYVAARNVTFDMNDVRKLCDRFFETFSVEEWRKRVDDSIKCEDEYRAQESMIDDAVDDVIVSIRAGTGLDVSDENTSDTENESDSLSGAEEV